MGAIEANGVGFRFHDRSSDVNYYDEFRTLLRFLESQDKRIIYLIDEFPVAVQNIINRNGVEAANMFVIQNQELRKECNKKVLFCLTGSLDLNLVISRCSSSKSIIDLREVNVPLLSDNEVKEIFVAIVPNTRANINEDIVSKLLGRFRHWTPYFVQLIIQEFHILARRNIHLAEDDSIQSVIDNLIDYRNDKYFEDYHDGIVRAYPNQNDYDFAIWMLNVSCSKNGLFLNDIEEVGKKMKISRWKDIMFGLMFTGYLVKTTNNELIFTSEILRLWWSRKSF